MVFIVINGFHLVRGELSAIRCIEYTTTTTKQYVLNICVRRHQAQRTVRRTTTITNKNANENIVRYDLIFSLCGHTLSGQEIKDVYKNDRCNAHIRIIC